jgi:nucleotide-binding universal stress UspA family protein
MRTILFATDFSADAEYAGAYALLLARRLQAELVCIHASPRYDARPNAYELSHGHLEEFRQRLQSELAHRRATLEKMVEEAARQGIRARHDVVEGTAAEVICDTADSVGADLIVVGSHGRTGIKRYFLGSVAERVVRMASCSVLVARKPMITEHGFHHVLVPTDFEEGSREALLQARALAADDAVIDIVHCWFVDGVIDGSLEPGATGAVYTSMVDTVLEDARQNGQKLVDLVAGDGRQINFHIHEGRPAGAVQTFMEEQDSAYDLVAVGTHGRRGIERVLLGSVAEATVRYSPCSVLVVRARPS